MTLRTPRKNIVSSDVVVVRDGAEAFDSLCGHRNGLANAAAMPQLILLDRNLPKIVGLEVLRRIRADKRVKLLPVVILTSSGGEQDTVHGHGLGVNAYVRKAGRFLSNLQMRFFNWNCFGCVQRTAAGELALARVTCRNFCAL